MSILSSFSLRESRILGDGWYFRREDDVSWKEVTLPHTGNEKDGRGHGAYFRGKGFYRYTIPALSSAKRYFLYFEGACLVATVCLNGKQVVHHRGGFTGFHVPLPVTEEDIQVEVEVDNGFFHDVAPIAGDFNIYGGLYRSVSLVGIPNEGFFPLEEGYCGTGVEDITFSGSIAKVTWSAHVAASKENTLHVFLRDAEGQQGVDNKITLEAADSEKEGSHRVWRGVLEVEKPIRWHGISNPYCYEMIWELRRGAQVLDRLQQTIGFRTLERDEDTGRLQLNGEEIILRGVCKHQEIGHQLSAVSFNEIRCDLELITELGANAVRLAHYPHSRSTLEECDRLGLLAWVEIPLVDKLEPNETFEQTTKRQLREMIVQYRHHPSVFAWGLFNEVYAGGSEERDELIFNLQAEAKKLDPSRLTVCAAHTGTPPSLHNATELLAVNLYFGWYRGEPEAMAEAITDANEIGHRRGIAVSEYGAGGNPWHHEEPVRERVLANGVWHPEEWQAQCHERQYEAIRNHPDIWGSFIWVLADFYSSARKEGGLFGVNDKGLVTIDRSIRKDVYFFYKAIWSLSPVLHILSKRNIRPAHSPEMIRIYSNQGCPEVLLDGEPLSLTHHQYEVVYAFTLPPLSAGEHRIHARLKTLSDERIFIL